MEATAGHEEREFQAALSTKKSLAGSGARKIIPRAAQAIVIETDAQIAEEQGDFREAAEQYEKLAEATDFEGSQWVAIRMGAADDALAHNVSASRRLLGNLRDADVFPLSAVGFGWQLPNFRLAQFEQAMALGDWLGAQKIATQVLSPREAKLPGSQLIVRTLFAPWLALAEAKAGDIKAARARIVQTPLDCYLCVRMRGNIEATQKNWSDAGYWLARAVQQAPSIPFAYFEWGQMLMAKGDYDGAIAKFTLANQKGPHFADSLEMWGDALIAQNRSDLALAKFEEANKYAPNWGRLHLKWAEALFYAGQKADAQKQFAIAKTLDLSATDKSELAKTRS
jgi:tetratricopeptide (TPR) repeat protein